jgi:hypothetical protein
MAISGKIVTLLGDPDRIHIAFGESEFTLCDQKWNKISHKEALSEDDDASCYRCEKAARAKILKSLVAGRKLARKAGLDWESLEKIAQYDELVANPIYDRD